MHKIAYALVGVGVALEALDYYDTNSPSATSGTPGNPTILDSIKNFNEVLTTTSSSAPSGSVYLHLGVLMIVAGAAILLLHKGAS